MRTPRPGSWLLRTGQILVLYDGDQAAYDGIVVLGRLDGDAAARVAELDGPVTATVEALDG